MSDYSDYELYHYGVKGMKWGVRRSPKELAKGSVEKLKKAGPRGVAKAAGRGAKTAGKSYLWSSKENSQKRVDRVLKFHGEKKVRAIAHTVTREAGKAFLLGTVMAPSLLTPAAPIAAGSLIVGATGTTVRTAQDVVKIVKS